MESTTGRVLEKDRVKPFGMQDKIGYMLGDLGNDLFFSFISAYLMLFYTDVLGIAGGAVGTMLIVARIWDAINDVMMGTFVDNRKAGKHGKFRPYFLYGALPVTIMGFLTFTAIPGLPESFKLPYAYITYIGFGMCYTVINIPYGSLASVMTTDPVERTQLSSFRTLGYLIANLVLMILVPMLIFDADGAATAQGFVTASAIFVVLANLCYFGAFKLTTERVKPAAKEKQEKISFVKTVKKLVKNRALLGLMLTSFGILASSLAVSALTPYLYKDYFNAPKLVSYGGLISIVGSFVVLPFAGKLVEKFGKKEVTAGTMILGIVGNIILFVLPIKNPFVYMGIFFVASLGTAFFNVLIWAMVGDAIDYQEYITGEREEGIVYASYSLVRKLGQAFAGGIGGFALTFIGYQAGAKTQTAEVALGIKNIITMLPVICTVFSFIAIIFVYNLSKSKVSEVASELEARRS